MMNDSIASPLDVAFSVCAMNVEGDREIKGAKGELSRSMECHKTEAIKDEIGTIAGKSRRR
jgi:hypothetical protein